MRQGKAMGNDLIMQAGTLLSEVEARIALLARQADERYHDLLAQWQQASGGAQGDGDLADGLQDRLAECRRVVRQLNLLACLHRELISELDGQAATPSENDLRADLPRIRLVRSQEEAYQRIAQKLRNGVGQIMANAVLELEYFGHLGEADLPAAREGLQSLKEEIRVGFKDLQRIIEDLGPPPLLIELGLAPSLRRYVENFRDELDLEVTVDVQALPADLPPTMETAIFRIVQEALLNVRKHAQATCVEVQARVEDNQLTVRVVDNGRGFQVDSHDEESAPRLGLVSMRDRADLLGGRLQIKNRAQRGTEVLLSVPFPSAFMGQSHVAGGEVL